jgi:hypothetical protein
MGWEQLTVFLGFLLDFAEYPVVINVPSFVGEFQSAKKVGQTG